MSRPASILCLLLALTAACTRDSVIYGQCSTIFDCRTGQACSQAGHCEEGPALPAGLYGIELLPAINSGTGPVRNELSQVTLGGGDIALDFQEPVVLSGRVLKTTDTNQTMRSISAAVTVTRKSRIGLTEATYSVDAIAGKASGEGAFSLRLPPTKTASNEACVEPDSDCYELRVVPSELNLFPPLVQPLALPSSTDVDLALGSLDLVVVHGTVKDATLNGLAGLEVRAVDGDGRTVSSVVTTSSDGDAVGEFVLSLSGSVVGKVWLQVSASQQSPNVPRFIFAFESDGAGPLELGDLMLLAFQAPVSVTYRVKGTATNGQSQLVEGALVRFTSYLSDVFPAATPSKCPTDTCAIYTRQGTTDANGEVTLTLIPSGAYEVDILPGPNSPYSALHVGGVEVGQGGVAGDLALDRKLEIRGTVVDSQGQPVAAATVAATPREVTVTADAGAGESPAVMKTADLALDESPSSGQTDEAGQFLLMLEPGVSYDVVVTPSASSPDPVTTLLQQQFQEATTINIQLPEAALLAGTVSAWDGSDTQGTLVRIYELVQDDPDTTTRTAWLRGEAVATADGDFKLLLPAGAALVQ